MVRLWIANPSFPSSNLGTVYVKIYGVVVDDKLHKLHAQVAPIQKDSFDMAQVYIKGLISKNPNAEGWPEVITIKDIDSVAPI